MNEHTNKSLIAAEHEAGAGRTAPRISLDEINDNISEVHYALGMELGESDHASMNCLTLCLVVCNNGFVVVGKSAPASPENFDAGLGRKLAYEDCVRQLWPIMGYALRERLTAAGETSEAE